MDSFRATLTSPAPELKSPDAACPRSNPGKATAPGFTFALRARRAPALHSPAMETKPRIEGLVVEDEGTVVRALEAHDLRSRLDAIWFGCLKVRTVA